VSGPPRGQQRIDLSDDLARLLDYLLSNSRERERLRAAIHQGRPEIFFELPDLGAQRGLGNMTVFSGAPKMRTIRERHEIAKFS
jgi:hypothetical protein